MRVTTGGVTVGVGALIVGTLGIAAVMTVRDENDTEDLVECQPQTAAIANAASKAFLEEHFPSGQGDTSLTGSVGLVLSSESARNEFGEATSIPDWSDRGYVVVVVDADPRSGQDLPTCFDETPILYVEDAPNPAE